MLPTEFTDRIREQTGDEGFRAFSAEMDCPPVKSLRINKLKADLYAGEFGELLSYIFSISDGPVEWCHDGLYYLEDKRPGLHPFHEAGAYYIQEASAMAPALILINALKERVAAMEGARVLDLCAAPGGKSTQLAVLMRDHGVLCSNEISGSRAAVLSGNIERMGIKNALVFNEAPKSLRDRFPGYFHGILVDAPCSGEGMFRKDPEAIDEWSSRNVSMCADRQRIILSDAISMLSPGGVLVYSTCTFSEEENEDNVRWLLSEYGDMALLDISLPELKTQEHMDTDPIESGCLRLWPHHVRGEGHFAAAFVKEGRLTVGVENSALSDRKRSGKGSGTAPSEKLWQDFVRDEIPRCGIEGRIQLYGDDIHILPWDAPDIAGIRCLRPGLHAGNVSKGRFKPSHALAMALAPHMARLSIDLPYKGEQIRKFYRGESLELSACMAERLGADPGLMEASGWILISTGGLSAGWGKLVKGTIKNHYPKGLRKEL